MNRGIFTQFRIDIEWIVVDGDPLRGLFVETLHQVGVMLLLRSDYHRSGDQQVQLHIIPKPRS